MKLFQYAVFFVPNEEQYKSGDRAKILVEPKTVLTSDDKSAMILAARDIPTEYLDKIDQIQVACRPF